MITHNTELWRYQEPWYEIFLYHESYNKKIEGPYMVCECTCIKNIIDVHVNKSTYVLHRALKSKFLLYRKIHIFPRLTHKNSKFLLFFPDPNACCLYPRPLYISSNCKSMKIFLDQVTELVLSNNNKVSNFKIRINCT